MHHNFISCEVLTMQFNAREYEDDELPNHEGMEERKQMRAFRE